MMTIDHRLFHPTSIEDLEDSSEFPFVAIVQSPRKELTFSYFSVFSFVFLNPNYFYFLFFDYFPQFHLPLQRIEPLIF